MTGWDLGRVVDTLLCGDQTNWVMPVENPSQFLAHSRCSVMVDTLKLLEGTKVQHGAGLFSGTLSGWLAGGSRSRDGQHSVACGPSGSRAWSLENGVLHPGVDPKPHFHHGLHLSCLLSRLWLRPSKTAAVCVAAPVSSPGLDPAVLVEGLVKPGMPVFP